MRKVVIGKKVDCDYRKTCYGIVKCNDKFLLSYNDLIKEYSLPGGGVEEDESLEECISREFAEEVGFKVLRSEEYVNIDCFWVKRDGRNMETDANFFLIEVDLLNAFPPTEYGHRPVWVDKEVLLSCITFPYQLKALEILFEEIKKIDFWN